MCSVVMSIGVHASDDVSFGAEGVPKGSAHDAVLPADSVCSCTFPRSVQFLGFDRSLANLVKTAVFNNKTKIKQKIISKFVKNKIYKIDIDIYIYIYIYIYITNCRQYCFGL